MGLVADRQLTAFMSRLFDLVGQGNCIVLKRNPAITLFVGNQFRGSETELAGPLTGLEESGRAEVGPVDIRSLENPQRVFMRPGNREECLGQITGCDESYARRDFEKSGAALPRSDALFPLS